MSDYSDIWYELNKDNIEKEHMANIYRNRLTNELSIDDMITIMFTSFLNKQNDSVVIKMAEKNLKN